MYRAVTLSAASLSVLALSSTRLVRFCCGGCVKVFEKNPAKHLATVDARVEQP